MGLLGWIKEKQEERRDQQHNERLRDSQRRTDIASGRFCKKCMRTGEFSNQCYDCKRLPFCDVCIRSNERFGIICLDCAPKYLCMAKGCTNLFDDKCVLCTNRVCQTHWGILFVYEKNKVFSCVYPEHRGNVCLYCVSNGITGTFRKKYTCPNCKNELHQKTIN